jgi:DMSO/TMAO reductase YedYZ molybdopterin-dependent catalytic subunit
MLHRRQLIQGGAAALAGSAAAHPMKALALETATLPFANGERPLVQYPQKRKLLRLTTRPPQLETPFSVYDEGVVTPNDAFFVRYHLADIPLAVDPDKFTLEVKGKVDKPLKLSLADIKAMPSVELLAVNQCSGNGRGFFEPRVAGGQAGNGLMGNARWKGVVLKTVLDLAGVQPGAKQATFDGLDEPALDATPDFIKALDIDHARDGEVMLAYEMNGADLPMLNGYPLRLVVPGHYGTYWVKHLNEITVIDTMFDGFWMKSAYRVPANACACIEPGAKVAATVPIGRFNVRSFITNLGDGAKVKAGAPTLIRGVAFDGGYGVSDVLLSPDDGATWASARLGADFGKYSFREFEASVSLPAGDHVLKTRAINRIGQSQPDVALWNPAGYMRNVVETVRVSAV